MPEFHTYNSDTTYPEVNKKLQEYYNTSYPLSLSIFGALGSFWKEYYSDSTTLNVATIGFIELLNTKIKELYHQVLASSIINIPDNQRSDFELFVLDSNSAVYVYTNGTEHTYEDVITTNELTTNISYIRYSFDKEGIASFNYLVNYLLEPSIVLKKNIDYSIDLEHGLVYFYVDIFRDVNILNAAYIQQTYSKRIYILFWGIDIVLNSYYIYYKYGTFLYSRDIDSKDYRLLITALQYFYANTKNVENIENILNILVGVPFCKNNGEQVIQIVNPTEVFQKRVVYTDVGNIYELPFYVEPVISVGDKLEVGRILGKWIYVNDYISKPYWYSNLNSANFQLSETDNNPTSSDVDILYNGYYFYNGDILYSSDELNVYTDQYNLTNICTYNYYDSIISYSGTSTYGPYSPFYHKFNSEYLYNREITYGPYADYLEKTNSPGLSSRFPTELFENFNHQIYERDFDNDGQRALVQPDKAIDYINKWYRTNHYSSYPEEDWLYHLVDKLLKYNLIYINVNLTINSYHYFNNDIRQYVDVIKEGLPFYIHPVIDLLYYPLFTENYFTGRDIHRFDANFVNEDTALEELTNFEDVSQSIICAQYIVDGAVPSLQTYFFYDGTHYYDGTDYYSSGNVSYDEFEFGITINSDNIVEEPITIVDYVSPDPFVNHYSISITENCAYNLYDGTLLYNGGTFYFQYPVSYVDVGSSLTLNPPIMQDDFAFSDDDIYLNITMLDL